jgi:flavin-dependent thymidylate synthase
MLRQRQTPSDRCEVKPGPDGLRLARKYMDGAVAQIMAELNGEVVEHENQGREQSFAERQHYANLESEANRVVPGKTVQKWADQAMFTAEPIDATQGPQVHLLWMTADPLAVIAAPSKMYKGEVARSLRDVTHAERQEYVEQLKATKLKAPYEFVKFHFLIEGVTRAFTHQMVRQRTAVYAQESLRFAVKEDMPVALPPSLAGTTGVWRHHERDALNLLNNNDRMEEYDPGDEDVEMAIAEAMTRESEAERQRWAWDQAVSNINSKYQYLVNSGVPAEDARGLLPHNTLTRLHYCTDLRALLDHAGNRLCTQAQFEWRLVFAKIAEEIRLYNPYSGLQYQLMNLGEQSAVEAVEHCARSDAWQYEAIADLFRPVCYLTGKCEFKANFDRKCSIRERVDANAAYGRPSSEWHEEKDLGFRNWDSHHPMTPWARKSDGHDIIPAINPAEWLLNPGAAR